MSETFTSDHFISEDGFPVAKLPAFCSLVRARGILITPAQQAEVVQIALHLMARGELTNAIQYQDYVRSVICKSSKDVQSFDQGWKEVFNTHPKVEPTVSTVQSGSPSFWRRYILGFFLALVGACIIYFVTQHNRDTTTSPTAPNKPEKQLAQPDPNEIIPGNQPQPETGVAGENTSAANEEPVAPVGFSAILGWNSAIIVVSGLAVVSGAAFYLFRRRYLRRKPAGASSIPDSIGLNVINTQLPRSFLECLPTVTRQLRQPVAVESFVIDPQATASSSARQAGFLTPQWRVRRRIPEYGFLVEEQHRHDHWSRLVRTWLDSLESQGVQLSFGLFRENPDRVFGRTQVAPSALLNELSVHSRDRRIAICCESLEVFSPFTGTLEPWVKALVEFDGKVALLVPANLSLGLGVRQLCEQMPIPVFRFNSTGVSEMAEWFAGKASRQPPKGNQHAFQVPAIFSGNTDFETHSSSELEIIVEELAAWLGKAGMIWFRACAVFPQINWRITAGLGAGLCSAGEISVSDQDSAFHKLIQLPWMRRGYVPDTLRRALVRGLDPVHRALIRELLHCILVPTSNTEVNLDRSPDAIQLEGESATSASPSNRFQGQFRETICRSVIGGGLAFPLPSPATISWRKTLLNLLPKGSRLPKASRANHRRYRWRQSDPSGLLHQRVAVSGVLLILLFALLGWRIALLQLDSRIAENAMQAAARRVVLPATRGEIASIDGQILARNEQTFDLVLNLDRSLRIPLLSKALRSNPAEVSNLSAAEVDSRCAELLATHLHEHLEKRTSELMEEIRRRLESNRGEAVLAKWLSVERQNAIAKSIQAARIDTLLRLVPRPSRLYPEDSLANQTVGFVDINMIGRSGIEGNFNSILKGRDGYIDKQVDSRGLEILQLRGRTQDPVHGANVRLSLDTRVQKQVEAILSEQFATQRSSNITAIIMESATGRIVAMANVPSYDRASMQGIQLNMAVHSAFEMGGIFSIIPVAEAFERGLVEPETVINTEGGRYQDGPISITDAFPNDTLSVGQVLSEGSNIGAFKIAQQLGAENFSNAIARFGFGMKTGIELPNESPGIVHSANRWSKTSLSSHAIGYEIAVTPLQMLTAISIFANDGLLIPPTLVSELSANGQLISDTISARQPKQIIGARAAKKMIQCMTLVVEKGSGKSGGVAGYSVAGKTGSARKYDQELRRYRNDSFVLSFAGFLPADNPRLIGIVVVDGFMGPAEDAYGGKIAAPIFSRIMEEAAKTLQIPNK